MTVYYGQRMDRTSAEQQFVEVHLYSQDLIRLFARHSSKAAEQTVEKLRHFLNRVPKQKIPDAVLSRKFYLAKHPESLAFLERAKIQFEDVSRLAPYEPQETHPRTPREAMLIQVCQQRCNNVILCQDENEKLQTYVFICKLFSHLPTQVSLLNHLQAIKLENQFMEYNHGGEFQKRIRINKLIERTKRFIRGQTKEIAEADTEEKKRLLTREVEHLQALLDETAKQPLPQNQPTAAFRSIVSNPHQTGLIISYNVKAAVQTAALMSVLGNPCHRFCLALPSELAKLDTAQKLWLTLAYGPLPKNFRPVAVAPAQQIPERASESRKHHHKKKSELRLTTAKSELRLSAESSKIRRFLLDLQSPEYDWVERWGGTRPRTGNALELVPQLTLVVPDQELGTLAKDILGWPLFVASRLIGRKSLQEQRDQYQGAPRSIVTQTWLAGRASVPGERIFAVLLGKPSTGADNAERRLLSLLRHISSYVLPIRLHEG